MFTVEALAAFVLAASGWSVFSALAAAVRPRRAPLLQARPEYTARHSTVLIGDAR